MATTATNKQPLLVDRVLHNVIETNTLTSGSDTSLDILGTNQSAVLLDCTGTDGGVVEDLYAISRTETSTAYLPFCSISAHLLTISVLVKASISASLKLPPPLVM